MVAQQRGAVVASGGADSLACLWPPATDHADRLPAHVPGLLAGSNAAQAVARSSSEAAAARADPQGLSALHALAQLLASRADGADGADGGAAALDGTPGVLHYKGFLLAAADAVVFVSPERLCRAFETLARG